MRRRALVCCALICLGAPAAFSQDFELTPFIGYQFGGSLDFEDELGPFRIDVNNASFLGVAFDLPLGRSFQIELLVSRQETEIELDEGIFGFSIPLADVDFTYYHAGFLWQLNVGQVKPFFVLTGGLTEIDPGLPGLDAEFRPSLAIGGGVKLIFTDHVGLRLEGRGYFTDVHDELGCCPRDEEEILAQGAVSAGLILRF